MKKLYLRRLFPCILVTVLSLLTGASIYAQVGINTTGNAPDTSAMLDVSSSDKGILIPRMDSIGRTAILQPADGLMVYDTTTTTFWYYDEEQWNEIRNGETKLNAFDLAESLPEPDFSCLQNISQLNIAGGIVSIARNNEHIYVLQTNTLNAVDVTDPQNPVLISSLSLATPQEAVDASQVEISGNYAYVLLLVNFSNGTTSDLLRIIDISDPESMFIVDTDFVGNSGRAKIAISGNSLYFVSTTEFLTYDISDPENINNVGFIGTSNDGSSGMAVLDNLAFVVTNSVSSGFFEVVDVSNLSSPNYIATLDIGNSPKGVAASGNYAYVVSEGSNDLKVIDVSTPSAPSQITSLNLGGSPKAIEIAGNYAYVVSTGSNDLKVIDISDPTNPALIRSISAGQANHVEILDNYAYVANNNLNVFELSCPFSLDINPSSGEFVATSAFNIEEFTLNETTSELTLNSNQFTPTADLSALRKFGTIDTGIESTDQGTSNQAGNGFTTTPWVYTNAVEAQGERGTASTLITIGDDGTYGADDQIHLVTDGSSRLRVNANGNVGIGRNPTSRILEVNGNASKSSAGDWLANSDARLKKNIQPLNAETILQKLLSLQGITYEWDDDKTDYARPTGPQYGFTAQNIQEVFPTLVEEDAEGYLQTAYGTYDAMYVEAIRALQQQIDDLKADNTQLKAENEQLQKLKSEVADIKAMLSTTPITSSE